MRVERSSIVSWGSILISARKLDIGSFSIVSCNTPTGRKLPLSPFRPFDRIICRDLFVWSKLCRKR